MRHGFEFTHYATQINLPADGSLFSDCIPSVRAAGFNVVFERVRVVISGQTDAARVDYGDEVAAGRAGNTD